jgi:hypothetical protein
MKGRAGYLNEPATGLNNSFCFRERQIELAVGFHF